MFNPVPQPGFACVLTVESYNHAMNGLLSRVTGWTLCPTQPSPLGLRSWSYPWDDMQPGHVIMIPDPSPAARNRLAAAASQASKRLGIRIATGPYVEGGERAAWWAVRYDGCEIADPPPSVTQLKGEAQRARFAERRRKSAEGRFRRQRMQPLSALGDHAPDVAPVIPDAPIEEADAWLRPVVAGEVF